MQAVNGIIGASQIGVLRRTDAPSAVRTRDGGEGRDVPSSNEGDAPTEVPNVASTQAFYAAVEATEQGLRQAASRLSGEDAGEPAPFVDLIEWPEIPPRDPASGDVLQPLRSRLADVLDPRLDEVEAIGEELRAAEAEGVPPDRATVERGLELISEIKNTLSGLVQESVQQGLGGATPAATRVDEPEAEASALRVGALVAEDPARATAAAGNIPPGDVLALLE